MLVLAPVPFAGRFLLAVSGNLALEALTGEIRMAKVKIRTVAERQQAGKSLRSKCPRLSHSKVILGHGKRDIVALIKGSKAGLRIDPHSPWTNAPVRVCVFSRHGVDTSARPQGNAK